MTIESTVFPLESRTKLYSFIVLLCIASKEVFKLCFLLVFSDIGEVGENYATLWIGLQVVFSIVAGHLSDKHCRKSVLAFTVLISSLSILLLYMNQILPAVIIDGIFCNVTAVARAAYCDVSYFKLSKHYKGKKEGYQNEHGENHGRSHVRIIAESYAVQALPWVIICSSYKIYNSYVFKLAILTWIVSFFSSFFVLKIQKDKNHSEELSMISSIKRLGKTKIRIFLSFLFLGISYHLMQYYLDSHFQKETLSNSFFLLGVGIFIGNIVHLFVRFVPNLKNLFTTYLICALLFVFGYISSKYFSSASLSNFSYYLPFAGISSFALPLIYAGFIKHTKIHEEGFLFGILEALLSLAEFLGPILSKMNIFNFPTFIILLLICSFLTYQRPRKNKEKSHNINSYYE